MKLTKINYKDLNARQKESYNFTKVAALLSDYGFNSILLNDDWHGADFIALSSTGDDYKVQLKSRLTIDKKYIGKGIIMAFPYKGDWYFVDHDQLIEIACETTPWLESKAWATEGLYTSGKPSKKLLGAIAEFKL